MKENLLADLSLFYSSIIQLFAYVNNLFYESNTELSLPHNIWFSKYFPFYDKTWYLVGVSTILDMPVVDEQIDCAKTQELVGVSPRVWLHCYTLQGTLMKFYLVCTPVQHMPHPSLKVQMKSLLTKLTMVMLTLTRWE